MMEVATTEATTKAVKAKSQTEAKPVTKNQDDKVLFEKAKVLGKVSGEGNLSFFNLLKLAASAQREFEVEKFLQSYKSGRFAVSGEEGEDDGAGGEISGSDVSRIKAAMRFGTKAGDDAERVIDNIFQGRKLAIKQKLPLNKQKDGTNERAPHHLSRYLTILNNDGAIPVPGGGNMDLTSDLLTGREEISVSKTKTKVTYNPDGLKKWCVALAIDVSHPYEWDETEKVWNLLPDPVKPQEEPAEPKAAPDAPAAPVDGEPTTTTETKQTQTTVSVSDKDQDGAPVENNDGGPSSPKPTRAAFDKEAATNLFKSIHDGLIEAETLQKAQEQLGNIAALMELLGISIA
jgi:hypothetical protein